MKRTLLYLLPVFLLAMCAVFVVAPGVASADPGNLDRYLRRLWGGVQIGQTGTAISDSYAASSTIDFASTNAQTCTDSSGITVTGAAVNDICAVGPPASGGATSGTLSCFVSAANTVKVRFCNPTSGAVDPASATYAVRVIDP